MKDSVLAFYDDLAEAYHLIFVDWKQAISWQGEILDKIIRSKLTNSNSDPTSLLDCSCGIGTQAIGLAKHGYNVTATDISPAAVVRAEQEAAAFGVNIDFGIADFRSLEKDVSGSFEVVLSADNAIPHLLTDEDLYSAARNLYAKTDHEGVLIITIRNYDDLIKDKPRSTEPRVYDKGKRIVFQIWDWAEDAKTYWTNQFILQEIDGEWKTRQNKTQYRALLRDEFSHILSAVGFTDIEWLMPAESGYYQPIVIARKQNEEDNHESR
ncbi:class I SAM-dependent methyltransferase [Paenibacillus solisilvae]|uniref:Class I SAM-dependent methyltransferase n=1 Tax=Paenibacillus solisilvae TaxID=2486751 RepID=A0ABW0VYQ9_9BACL